MKLGIVGNLAKSGLQEAVALLLSRLEAGTADYVVDRRIIALPGVGADRAAKDVGRDYDRCLAEAELVIAFGGDGTILGVARDVGARATPILGVNLGKLGFLAELAPDELGRAVDDLLARRFQIEDRLVLEASCPSLPGKVIHAINDVVVDKSRSPRLIDLDAHIDGAFAVTYRGDGLIISSPTGSTAYALSNNGPIVTPTSRVLGITPISPHTLSGRPLIVPDSSVIRLFVHAGADEALLSADGRVEALLKPPAEITVRRAGHSVRLVRMQGRTYFDVLRAKLLWGQDVRSVQGGENVPKA